MPRVANPYRVRDETRQARDDLAELMAEGCPSISEAARRLGLSQRGAADRWDAIKRDLGVAQCR